MKSALRRALTVEWNAPTAYIWPWQNMQRSLKKRFPTSTSRQGHSILIRPIHLHKREGSTTDVCHYYYSTDTWLNHTVDPLKHSNTLTLSISVKLDSSYSAKAHKKTINPSHWPHETGLGVTEEFTEDTREDEGEGNGNYTQSLWEKNEEGRKAVEVSLGS